MGEEACGLDVDEADCTERLLQELTTHPIDKALAKEPRVRDSLLEWLQAEESALFVALETGSYSYGIVTRTRIECLVGDLLFSIDYRDRLSADAFRASRVLQPVTSMQSFDSWCLARMQAWENTPR